MTFNELKIGSDFSWVMPNGSLSDGWLKTGDTTYRVVSWPDDLEDDELSKVGDYDQGLDQVSLPHAKAMPAEERGSASASCSKQRITI